jgi:hypothetical protein
MFSPARCSPLSVLFIGNSYTYVNDLPALLAALLNTELQTQMDS